jgi:hypothetical protein
MHAIAALIRRSLRLSIFLPLLALSLLATWYGLGPSQVHFAALTDGQRFVDVQPALTADSLITQARSYRPDAVHYYLQWSGFDFAWPLLTFTATMFIAGWLFRFLPAGRQGLFTFIVAAGYAAVLMDWGENLAFVWVVLHVDPPPSLVARLAVTLHSAKLIFLAVFNLACLTVLFWALGRKALAMTRA